MGGQLYKGLAIVVVALIAIACGATTRNGAVNAPRLISATLIFTNLNDGKDAGSALTAQLLHGGNQLGAEARSAGTEFDDNSTSAPLAMTPMGSFGLMDVQEGTLRLRLTPEGRDTWTFNVRLTLAFSDNTQRDFAWTAVRLDQTSPERTLTLAGAGA